ncbi:hypothetical protein [Lentibacillus amyloliquefaciens]|nr:hypothetical protein [Lentibacillus amyloliquefaciens]
MVDLLQNSGGGGGDMLKETYDTNDDGKVDVAESADSVAWANVSGKPSTYPPESHNHDGTYASASHSHASGVAAIADPTTATAEDVANKINELLTALQGG